MIKADALGGTQVLSSKTAFLLGEVNRAKATVYVLGILLTGLKVIRRRR